MPIFTQLCCSCAAGSIWQPTMTAYVICVNSSDSPVSEGQMIQPKSRYLEFKLRKGKQLILVGSESHFSSHPVVTSLWLHLPPGDCLCCLQDPT